MTAYRRWRGGVSDSRKARIQYADAGSTQAETSDQLSGNCMSWAAIWKTARSNKINYDFYCHYFPYNKKLPL